IFSPLVGDGRPSQTRATNLDATVESDRWSITRADAAAPQSANVKPEPPHLPLAGPNYGLEINPDVNTSSQPRSAAADQTSAPRTAVETTGLKSFNQGLKVFLPHTS
ncbi:nucleoprotein, partial [Striga asiatica]